MIYGAQCHLHKMATDPFPTSTQAVDCLTGLHGALWQLCFEEWEIFEIDPEPPVSERRWRLGGKGGMEGPPPSRPSQAES